MNQTDASGSLVALGFTALEAEAYCFLLQTPSATAYRVAKAIGKPVANTYKAIESLERKGAVIVDDGENRVCSAVPVDELLNQLQRRFNASRATASRALRDLGTETADDRLYQLQSRTQVFERCRAMLNRGKHVVVMDLAPAVVSALQDDIARTAKRGVEVVVKVYKPTRIDNVRIIARPNGHEVIDAMPGDLLGLNIDGAEHLLALLHSSGDGVYQAVWTGSAIVSYLLYNGLVNELSQVAVMRELEGDTNVEALRRVFSGLRHLHPASSKGPAYQNLMNRLKPNEDASRVDPA